jgi:hypothetical protein
MYIRQYLKIQVLQYNEIHLKQNLGIMETSLYWKNFTVRRICSPGDPYVKYRVFFFSCLTDKRRPKPPPNALPALRLTPHVGEV